MPTTYRTHKGKISIRYSELNNCTAKGIQAVLERRFGIRKPFRSEALDFGAERHRVWEEQVRRTGRTPEEFHHLLDIPVTYCEEQFAAEVFPGVVLNFTPDEVSVPEKAVIDTKTSIQAKGAMGYFKSPQLKIYAYALGILGIQIDWEIYLAEIWNEDHTEILDYNMVKRPITLIEKAEARRWITERAERLIVGIEYYKNELGLEEVSNE